MSILIKGMEMPKGCAFCRIGKRNGKKMVCPLVDEEWDIHDPMSADHMLDNCPLVPVPAHGRLIDADKMAESVKAQVELLRMIGLGDPTLKEIADTVEKGYLQEIANAPTIIQSEEGET